MAAPRARTDRRVPGSVRRLAARADEAGLSRRAFLALLGATGGLAACGQDDRRSFRSGRGVPGYLRWGNWPLYLDESHGSHPTLEQFQEESGIEVIYLDSIGDNDGFYSAVRNRLNNNQDIGYDLVVLTDWMAARWQQRGFTKAWDRAMMPKTANLLPELGGVSFDPGRTWSMPWQSGLTGLAWNMREVPGGIHSVDDLWSPDLRGRVDLMVELDDTIGLVLWSQGVDPSSDWGDDQFGAALEVVEQHVGDGHVRGVKNNLNYQIDLTSGSALACVAYSGDILQLNLEAREDGAEEDPYGFAVPDSGGLLWSDNFLVPYTSDRVEESQKLIDFYYDPHVAATVAAWVNYITPVVGAQEAMADIDEELVENETIFPTKETLARTTVFRPLDEAEDAQYSSEFARATGG
ncbi:MAG: spermidine/putrescine ABC transporter substrate-binding protein [Micrococcales bacterium]|nr:spermidine/putrescine ABC transporter substrate-binding protein [Micrococcales bacterium]